MTKTVWRSMAGVLALSIGGFVVSAQDKNLKPATGDKTPCPGCPNEPKCPFDMPCPAQCPATCPTPCPAQCPTQKECPTEPAVCPKSLPCVPPTIQDVPPPPPPPIPVQAVKPVSAFAPAVVPVVTTVPYKVRMEMIGATTQVELLRGEEVAVRVSCDRVDAQMPSGGLHAMGKVTVTAPGMEVRCNRLTIGWQTGEIAMEGQVRIMCQNGAQRTEMAAESVCCRLNGVGTGLDFSPAPPQSEAPIPEIPPQTPVPVIDR